MIDQNIAIIVGRAVRDADVKKTPNGTLVASVTVATNKYWKDKTGKFQQESEYHRVIVAGRARS